MHLFHELCGRKFVGLKRKKSKRKLRGGVMGDVLEKQIKRKKSLLNVPRSSIVLNQRLINQIHRQNFHDFLLIFFFGFADWQCLVFILSSPLF